MSGSAWNSEPKGTTPTDARSGTERARAIAAVVLGVFFLLTALAKLHAIDRFQGVVAVIIVSVLGDTGWSLSALKDASTVAVIVLEFAIGAALIVFCRRPRIPSLCACVLLAGFSALLAVLATRESAPACGCLGAWDMMREHSRAGAMFGIMRNGGLVMLACWIARTPLTTRRRSAHGRAGARAGFTVVEVLVVIVTIAVLLAILVPALGGAKKQAKEVGTLSDLRQCAAAIGSYADDHGGYFPYLGIPGEPERGTLTDNIWLKGPPSYFRGQSMYWPTAILRSGLDLSALDGFTLEAPGRLRANLWLTHAAHARPSYWVGQDPPELGALYAGVRIDEAVHPARKGLLLDVDLGDEAAQPTHWNVGFVDGSATIESMTDPPALIAGLGRPFAAVNWRVLTTPDGIRGWDY